MQPKPNNFQIGTEAFPHLDRALTLQWLDEVLPIDMTEGADPLGSEVLMNVVAYYFDRNQWTEATTLTIKGLASPFPDTGLYKVAYHELVDRATTQLPAASDVQLLLTSLKELHVLWALFLRWDCMLLSSKCMSLWH